MNAAPEGGAAPPDDAEGEGEPTPERGPTPGELPRAVLA
jgi:hypothetical protein